jgi:hypothetical protein
MGGEFRTWSATYVVPDLERLPDGLGADDVAGYVAERLDAELRRCYDERPELFACEPTGPGPAVRVPRRLTLAERTEVDAIGYAAYAGGRDRRPERDVRWLLALVDRLAPLQE